MNTASGSRSTVPGGDNNEAGGAYSFAAGRLARADSTGSFVWADSTDAAFHSTAVNQFPIRAGGGVDIVGNVTASGTIQSGSSIVLNGSTDTITATGGTISFDDENLTTTGTTTTSALTITGLDCTANASGGALTANASGVVSCSGG